MEGLSEAEDFKVEFREEEWNWISCDEVKRLSFFAEVGVDVAVVVVVDVVSLSLLNSLAKEDFEKILWEEWLDWIKEYGWGLEGEARILDKGKGDEWRLDLSKGLEAWTGVRGSTKS